MIQTSLSLYEIELALCKSKYFSYLRNIIAFNVNGISSKLGIWHECDMLVLSKNGYLTEIEIKRSWEDFLADFKKKHKHNSELIKYFYYCVPISLLDKVYDYLYDNDIDGESVSYHYYHAMLTNNYRKLFLEEQLELARYGAMRAVMLKEKVVNLQKKIQDESI